MRIFFALWPGEEVARRLIESGTALHARVGGRLAREASVHMTLSFLGETPVERVERLADAASGIPFEPFVMRLQRTGCWPHNGIGWIGPVQAPPALTRLVQHLQSLLVAQGFPLEERPFSPHVTLVRKARCRPLDAPAPDIEWQVNDFVLVRSALDRDGSNYSIIARWPAP